jgi:hypothetical protein
MKTEAVRIKRWGKKLSASRKRNTGAALCQ